MPKITISISSMIDIMPELANIGNLPRKKKKALKKKAAKKVKELLIKVCA